MKILYIHGYGSTGNAMKAQKLQMMFPDWEIVAPTFDYDRLSPKVIFDQLKSIIGKEQPQAILGSSTGGYYALCCMRFYQGIVWCVNPVSDILKTIKLLANSNPSIPQGPIVQKIQEYALFDQEVFQLAQSRNGQLHLALSIDDELLGDHHCLMDRYPNCAKVVWKEDCGHRFYKFDELKVDIAQSLGAE